MRWPRTYKGRTVTLLTVDGSTWTTYTIDGQETARGSRGSPSVRGAWKAAKAEINRAAKASPIISHTVKPSNASHD